jgi:AcrR family transcriptional regulator
MRPKDLDKLERVKYAAIKTIVSKGYYGATISQIAEEANVSDGYLYRHYANKAELVRSLFIENMNLYHNVIFDLIDREESVAAILKGSMSFLVDTISEAPEIILFIFIMDHDFNFEYPLSVKNNFLKIGQKIWAKGIKTKEVGMQRDAEDVVAISFGIPIKMLELRRKSFFTDEPLNETDIDNMVDICLKALK